MYFKCVTCWVTTVIMTMFFHLSQTPREQTVILLGTNISHPKALVKMIFLFQWWDMCVSCRFAWGNLRWVTCRTGETPRAWGSEGTGCVPSALVSPWWGPYALGYIILGNSGRRVNHTNLISLTFHKMDEGLENQKLIRVWKGCWFHSFSTCRFILNKEGWLVLRLRESWFFKPAMINAWANWSLNFAPVSNMFQYTILAELSLIFGKNREPHTG